jgi:uncharacterized protein with HEPN domain
VLRPQELRWGSPEFRARYPAIPWRQMNDLRNVLIHNYDGVDHNLVWGIVDREIPAVLEAVVRLLERREVQEHI